MIMVYSMCPERGQEPQPVEGRYMARFCHQSEAPRTFSSEGPAHGRNNGHSLDAQSLTSKSQSLFRRGLHVDP